jgi:hypothetical protein
MHMSRGPLSGAGEQIARAVKDGDAPAAVLSDRIAHNNRGGVDCFDTCPA